MPSLVPTSAQATVELTSPTTTSQSGRCASRDLAIGDHHPAGLLGMAARADAEMEIGVGQAEIGEESGRHVGVVMLAGMDQHRREIRRAASACQSGATFMKLGRAAAIRWTIRRVNARSAARAGV